MRTLNWRWLGRQLELVLLGVLVFYGGGVGGTLNGLVVVPLRIVTLSLVTLLGGLWLWRSRRQPDLPVFVLPLLGFWLALVITTIVSSDPRRSLAYVGYFGAVTLAYWTVADWQAGEEGRLETALHMAFALLVVFSFFELSRWLSGEGWRIAAPFVRPSSLMGSPNIYATLLLVAGPLVARRVVVAGSWPGRVLWSLWLVVLGVLLILAGSRGAWLGAMLGSLVFAVLALRAHDLLLPGTWWPRLRATSATQKALLAVLMLAVLVAAIAAVPVVSAQATDATHGSTSKRVEIWHAALSQFVERPFFGRGPFTYGDAYLEHVSVPPETPHNHAHNFVLNTAAEVGLPGLLVLAALGWTAWHAIRRQLRADDPASRLRAATAAALLVAVLTHNLVDVTFVPGITLLTLWALAVLLPQRMTEIIRDLGATTVRLVAAPILYVAVLAILAFPLPAASAASRAADAASRQDWSAAAEAYELAMRRDPAYDIYALDAAYIYARLAQLDGESATEHAIELYRDALARRPEYALHWANLGLLEYGAGTSDAALIHMRHAARLAPEATAFAELADIIARGGDATTDDLPNLTGFGQGITYALNRFHVTGPEIFLLDLPEAAP